MADSDLKSIADALVAHCRANTEDKALDTLYATDAVSVEPFVMPGAESAETHGVDAIKGKHAWWNANFEVHSATAEGPFLHAPDKFGVIFEADITTNATGARESMREVAIYTVANGQIVREEFFGDM